MKKRKIKINPGSKNTSKIKIKGKGEDEDKLKIRFKNDFEEPEDYIPPFEKYKKLILGGGISLLVVVFAVLCWWFLRDSSPPTKEADKYMTSLDTPKVLTGDTLIRAQKLDSDVKIRQWLSGYEVPDGQTETIEKQFRFWVGDDTLKAGHSLQVWVSKSDLGQIAKVHYEINDYNYLVWGMGDSVYMDLQKKSIDKQLKVVRDVIKTDFRNSLDANNIRLEILVKLERALAWKVDFFHLERGDAYSLVFEEHYVDGKFVETGDLKAAWFRTQGKEHFCYLFTDTQRPDYYDETSRPIKSSFLKSPLKYSRITSHFGIRTHPIDKTQKQHRGTDYAAQEGTDIHAVADGKVTAARFNSLNGNFVRIDHGQGYETIYLHLKGFGSGIRRGAKVTQDQVIGYVGSTGKSTGPHLCFNLKKNGKFLDYLKADLPLAKPMPAVEATKFFVVRDSLNQVLRPVQ